jgi:transposase
MTDRQWQCIKDLIPSPKPGGRPRSLDMRQVINAILYILVSGIQWRMLPKDYRNGKVSMIIFVSGAMMAPGSASHSPFFAMRRPMSTSFMLMGQGWST